MPNTSAAFVIPLLLISAWWVVPLQSQEPDVSAATESAAVTALQEAEALTRKLPKQSQAAVFAMIASEYERREKVAEANKLWSELDELLKEIDDASRGDLLVAIAKERAKAGNVKKAKTIVEEIEDEAVQEKAIRAVALVLAEQDKFKDAVVYAESLPRHSSILFVTMEQIGLAAAKAGDTELASRASRGMNPGFGGSMARKLHAICQMCNSFWKTGHKEDAVRFINQSKTFSDILKPDLETKMVVDLTQAALQSKDLELDLELLVDRVSESEEDIDKNDVLLAMANVLLNFDQGELIPQLEITDEDTQSLLEIYKFFHVVDSGDPAKFGKLKPPNMTVLAIGLIRMADTCVEKKDFAQAKSYLEGAASTIQLHLEEDSRPDFVEDIFTDFVASKSSIGQHNEALAMVRKYPDSAKVPELMVQVVAAMK